MQIERLPQHAPQEIQVVNLVPEQAIPPMQQELIDLLQILPTSSTNSAPFPYPGKQSKRVR
ncbi:MAG TPA: hypothetical protein VEL31_17255 [Ktedonobacteraceae bacterium]|nr:hypothetical protein [Ktedonobacteraceae bacterium]